MDLVLTYRLDASFLDNYTQAELFTEAGEESWLSAQRLRRECDVESKNIRLTQTAI